MLDPNKIRQFNLNRAQMILKGFVDDDIEKGKRMPIGTISHGHKKVAEGKWVPVKESPKTSKKQIRDATDDILWQDYKKDYVISVFIPGKTDKEISEMSERGEEIFNYHEGDIVHFKDKEGNERIGMVGDHHSHGRAVVRMKKEHYDKFADKIIAENKAKEEKKKPKKDLKEYVTKEGRKWYVDSEDIETGNKVAKPYDEIEFTYRGTKYTGTVGEEAEGRDDDVLPIVNVKKQK